MPSTLWAKRVRNFNVKFSASNNMFCIATESNHAHLMWFCCAYSYVALLCTAVIYSAAYFSYFPLPLWWIKMYIDHHAIPTVSKVDTRQMSDRSMKFQTIILLNLNAY